MGNGNSDYGFILGVTGHRDASVAKKEELEEHIDDLLEELQVALGTFPLTVACGLADGADRLVAGRRHPNREPALRRPPPVVARPRTAAPAARRRGRSARS